VQFWKTKWIYMATMMKSSFKTSIRLAKFAQKNKIKLMFNPSTYWGEHYFTLKASDGHTALELKDKNAWGVTNGLYNDRINLDWKEPYKKGSVTITSDGGIWDSWESIEKTDRYSFEYAPDTIKSEYEITLTSDSKIHIVSAPWTEYKTWAIIDDHWIDFAPYTATYIRNSDKEVRVIVQNPDLHDKLTFNSAGDLNIITANYTFINLNISETYNEPVVAGGTYNYTLRLNGTNASTSVILQLNNTNYTATPISTGANQKTYQITRTLNYAVNNVRNLSHNWYVSYPINNVSTSVQNQTYIT